MDTNAKTLEDMMFDPAEEIETPEVPEEVPEEEEVELSEELKNSHPVELTFPATDFPRRDYPNISGQTFMLDYDRESAVALERSGFKVTDFDMDMDSPLKAMFPVFYGAFRKNHPRITQEAMDEVFDALGAEDAQIVFTEMYKRLALVYVSLQEGDTRPKPKARLRLV